VRRRRRCNEWQHALRPAWYDILFYSERAHEETGTLAMFDFVRHKQCPGCHGTNVSRRATTTLVERLLELVWVRPFHCDYCGLRFYGWMRMTT
jgi:hypothetical protein